MILTISFKHKDIIMQNFDIEDFNEKFLSAKKKAKATGKTTEFTVVRNICCRVSPNTLNGTYTTRYPKKITLGYTSSMTPEDAIKKAFDLLNIEDVKKEVVITKERTLLKEYLDCIKCFLHLVFVVTVVLFVMRYIGIL